MWTMYSDGEGERRKGKERRCSRDALLSATTATIPRTVIPTPCVALTVFLDHALLHTYRPLEQDDGQILTAKISASRRSQYPSTSQSSPR